MRFHRAEKIRAFPSGVGMGRWWAVDGGGGRRAGPGCRSAKKGEEEGWKDGGGARCCSALNFSSYIHEIYIAEGGGRAAA